MEKKSLIVIFVLTFGLVLSTLLSGNSVYAQGGEKCVSTYNKDKTGGTIIASCPGSPSAGTLKQLCREGQLGDVSKCSSSQTAQGFNSNNPNRQDNGAGIGEKFTH